MLIYSNPELSKKQKIHLFIYIVDSMKAFGPASSYCTERCETFHGLMREQNIYGNHQASSRDIATRVALMDHCWERLKGIVHNKTSAEIVQWHTSLHGRGQRHGAMRMQGKPMVLKDILIHWDGHGDIDIGSLIELDNTDERVIPFKAINLILSNGRTVLVHNGEFIQDQLDDGFALGQLLMSYRSPSGGDCCLVKPCDPVTIPNSTIIRNELDCSLVGHLHCT